MIWEGRQTDDDQVEGVVQGTVRMGRRIHCKGRVSGGAEGPGQWMGPRYGEGAWSVGEESQGH